MTLKINKVKKCATKIGHNWRIVRMFSESLKNRFIFLFLSSLCFLPGSVQKGCVFYSDIQYFGKILHRCINQVSSLPFIKNIMLIQVEKILLNHLFNYGRWVA